MNISKTNYDRASTSYIHCLWLMLLYPTTKTLAENRSAEMCNFWTIALMLFLTGNGTKARTHVHVEIAHFPTSFIIRTRKVLGLLPRASQVLMIPHWEMCNFHTGIGSCYALRFISFGGYCGLQRVKGNSCIMREIHHKLPGSAT